MSALLSKQPLSWIPQGVNRIFMNRVCGWACVCVYGFTALLFLRGRVHVQSICLYLRHELLMSGCQHRRTPVSLGGSTGLEEPWGAAGFYSLGLCLPYNFFLPPPEPSVTWHHFSSIIIHKHTKKRYFSLFSSSPRSDFFFFFSFWSCCALPPLRQHVSLVRPRHANEQSLCQNTSPPELEGRGGMRKAGESAGLPGRRDTSGVLLRQQQIAALSIALLQGLGPPPQPPPPSTLSLMLALGPAMGPDQTGFTWLTASIMLITVGCRAQLCCLATPPTVEPERLPSLCC